MCNSTQPPICCVMVVLPHRCLSEDRPGPPKWGKTQYSCVIAASQSLCAQNRGAPRGI